MNTARIRRQLHAISFQLRQASVVAKALKSRHHPIIADIIPIRVSQRDFVKDGMDYFLIFAAK
jgi:hypothetical protein